MSRWRREYLSRTRVCESCGGRHRLAGGHEPDGTPIPVGECPIKRRRKNRTSAEWSERMRLLAAEKEKVLDTTDVTPEQALAIQRLQDWKKNKPW